jgi:hypothetical protein
MRSAFFTATANCLPPMNILASACDCIHRQMASGVGFDREGNRSKVLHAAGMEREREAAGMQVGKRVANVPVLTWLPNLLLNVVGLAAEASEAV